MEPEEKAFYKFAHDNGIGDYYLNEETSEYNFELDVQDMFFLIKQNIVFDGSKGGLVKGLRNNNSGGIFVLNPVAEDRYRYLCVVTSNFYISNFETNSGLKKAFQKLERNPINELFKDPVESIPEIPDCRIIDTGENPVSFILLSQYDQVIFNSATVKTYLGKIISLENTYSNYIDLERLN